MNRAIEHNPAQKRFQWLEEGTLSVLNYELDGNTLTILHTGVPEAVGGRGIAADLTQYALETARDNSWRVRPLCSYASAYIKRHPEYQALLA